MRFFAWSIFILCLFAFKIQAQTEIAIQAFEAGVIAAENKQHDRAVQHFERALEKSKFSTELPNEFLARINYNAGVCLYRLNRSSEAIEFLTRAVSQAENKYPKASRALAMAHAALGDWQAAEQWFAHVVRLDKRDAESWFDLAQIRLAQNDFSRAADGFQKAIRYKNVDRATAHNNLGVIAALAGDWATAEKQFETALAQSNGKLPEAIRNLNVCRAPDLTRDLIAKLRFVSEKNINNQKETKKDGK